MIRYADIRQRVADLASELADEEADIQRTIDEKQVHGDERELCVSTVIRLGSVMEHCEAIDTELQKIERGER